MTHRELCLYCTITVHDSQGAVFVLYNYSAWLTGSCVCTVQLQCMAHSELCLYCTITVHGAHGAVIETLTIELQCMTHKEL